MYCVNDDFDDADDDDDDAFAPKRFVAPMVVVDDDSRRGDKEFSREINQINRTVDAERDQSIAWVRVGVSSIL